MIELYNVKVYSQRGAEILNLQDMDGDQVDHFSIAMQGQEVTYRVFHQRTNVCVWDSIEGYLNLED